MRGSQAELARAVGVEQVRLRACPRAPGRCGPSPAPRRRTAGSRAPAGWCRRPRSSRPAPRCACRAGRAGTTRGDRGSARWPRRRSSAPGSPRCPGSKITGTSVVLTLRALRRRSARARGGAADRARRLQRCAVARRRVPVVALHLTVLGGDRRDRQAEGRGRVAAGRSRARSRRRSEPGGPSTRRPRSWSCADRTRARRPPPAARARSSPRAQIVTARDPPARDRART